jgi:two-component system chemotaxis response regulator CheB
MIRVLIVDDSPTARALLRSILEQDNASTDAARRFVVVGEAVDGAEGVRLTAELRPDVVTMDILMPGLDGFAATKEIMIATPTPIVVVSSTLVGTEEARSAVLALRAGAVAVLRRPPGPGDPGFEGEALRLVETLRAMADVKVVRHWRPKAPAGERPRREPLSRGTLKLVAIAASTGGPAALQRVLSALPATFPVPILIVQHITPGFTAGLCAWLDGVCSLHVKLAEPGETIRPHTVYVAPEERHLGLSAPGVLSLSGADPVEGFRPSGSFLFESVARVYGGAATAVILTGMGADGVAGLRALKRAGGRVIAQDRETSVVFGMPGAAVEAGLVDVVAPIDQIAERLMDLV